MDYMALARQVAGQITVAGASGDAYITIGKETNIQVRQGAVEKLSYAGSKGIGVRAIQSGRMGYAYTSDFSPESIDKTVAAALALSQTTDADQHRFIPEPQPLRQDELNMFDPAAEQTPVEDKVAFAREVEQAALDADPRVVMALYTFYTDGLSDVYLANSKGFSGTYKRGFAASYTQAMAVEGEERATGFGVGVGISINKIDARSIGRDAGQRAAGLLGGRPVPTQRGTVVYSPFAAASLVGALSTALTAESMQRNRSFLQGKMGQEVAADVVTVLDNALLPGGLASRPFDGEGNPSSATRLINEGVLQAVLHDSYTASQDGTDSTGNAGRSSHRQAPALAPSNFYLQPGSRTPEELIADVGSGLYVVDVMNTHSINPVSGDYSVSAKGFWIEDGRLTFPVNNVAIALPLDQLLLNVQAVADDLIFLPFGGAIGTPTFRVDGVMIGGE